MKSLFSVIVGAMCVGVLSVGYAAVAPDGKAIVDVACARCHGIKKVESAKKDLAAWEVTLDRMIKKGAKVKPEEREAVLKYLATFK